MNSYHIYWNLCQKSKSLKESYKRFSGLHKHHIVPKHMGGTDDSDNFAFLTIREHIIAHYLLYRIYKNPNDLRAMRMLGANLSPFHRKIVGEWCRDNKIGFHNATPEQRKEWSNKGLRTQKDSDDKNSFYYWSTEDGRKKRASMGGKIGGKKQAELKLGFHQPHIQRKAASLGGKSHKGKRCMYKPGDTSFKRIKPEHIQDYINHGYVFGSPIPSKKQYSS